MKNIKLWLLIAFLLCSLTVNSCSKGNAQTNETTEQILIQKVKDQDSIINEYRILQSLIDSNFILKQHFIAEKYKNVEPTKENIKKFLIEAEVLDPEESYQVALRETNNGITGIGKPPIYNHFGMKIPNHRFSWSIDKKISGYAIYKNWTYSYLDYDVYVRTGFKTWRKDLPKKHKYFKPSTRVDVIIFKKNKIHYHKIKHK